MQGRQSTAPGSFYWSSRSLLLFIAIHLVSPMCEQGSAAQQYVQYGKRR